jgi:ribosome biogenesis GTPase
MSKHNPAKRHTPDTDALQKPLTGRVVSAHGRHYGVELPDGSNHLCYPRGKRNDATVGDYVDVAFDTNQAGSVGKEGSLLAVHPRKNTLFRSDENRTKQFASNVDLVIIVTAVEPIFSDDLLGRALTGSWAANIQPLIILNKIDLTQGLTAARQRLAPYQTLSVPVIELCAHDSEQVHALLMPHMQNKTSLLLGQSGMGKSTLLNALIPSAQAATQMHSVALGAGKHTTTATRLYHLPNDQGYLVDSPGFQAFGLSHLSRSEIEQGFPEFGPYNTQCRFYNCTHQHEPGCGVLAALARGDITASRLALFQRLIESNAAARI